MFESATSEQPTSLSSLVGYDSPGEQVAACLSAAPGPIVMASLAMVEPGSLSADEQLDLVAAWERCASWVAAMQARSLAAMDLHDADDVVLCDRQVADETLHAELAPALRLSPEASARRVSAARLLAGRLSATGAMLASGRLGYLQALAVTEELGPLDPDVAAEVEARVLERATGRNVGSLRRLLRYEVTRADAAAADRRAARARARRRVQLWPLDDGMATVALTHAAADARFVVDTLDAWARVRGAGTAGHVGLDAGRADALVDLCRLAVAGDLIAATQTSSAAGDGADVGGPGGDGAGGGGPGNAGSAVSAPLVAPGPLPVCLNLTISLETLLSLRDDPAYLEGYGSLPPDVARRLAVDARWRRFVTDPVDGHLLDCGRVYEAPAALRRYLVARDRTCRFPGCSRAAQRCDCDHAEPFVRGGATSAANCGMLCRRHHRLKTLGLTRVARSPDGTVRWTTRLGRSYRVRPPAPDEPP